MSPDVLGCDMKTWHYLHFGYWPGEAPKEPDDIADCQRDKADHFNRDCPYCRERKVISNAQRRDTDEL